jgi:tRNA(fMet)-specific endonuclease VapC
MSYLVDTDWMIDGLSGRQTALAFLEAHRDEGLGVSLVTLGELYEGAYGSPDPEAHLASLERFLTLFTVVPLSDETMRHFGRLRALLRQQGTLIPDFDLLIAATALAHDLVLLTRNRRHFERIPELQLQ